MAGIGAPVCSRAMGQNAPGLAESLARLGTETAFSVLARARELERLGRDVIHLEIGEPDFDTPAHICEAAYASMLAGGTHYCPSAGIPEFRDVIADELARTRSVPVKRVPRPAARARRFSVRPFQ